MIVTPLHTPIVRPNTDLFEFLDRNVPILHDRDVLAITSKIVSICQGRIVKNDVTVDKNALIHREADRYLTHEAMPKYGFILTIKRQILIANAGIDESNGDGSFILWPEHIQQTTNDIWLFFQKKFRLTHVGVILTDSHTMLLRWGVTGIGLSWCGFMPLNTYVGKPDIFGRKFNSVQASVLDSLAGSAVYVMGEGAEQTPMAVISDIPRIVFQDRPPTEKECMALRISLEDDLYAPLLTSVDWKPGKK